MGNFRFLCDHIRKESLTEAIRLRRHIHHIYHLHIVNCNWHKQKTLVTTEPKQETKAKCVVLAQLCVILHEPHQFI